MYRTYRSVEDPSATINAYVYSGDGIEVVAVGGVPTVVNDGDVLVQSTNGNVEVHRGSQLLDGYESVEE